MHQIVICLSLASMFGLTQAFLHKGYSGMSPSIKATKMKRSHFNTENNHFSGKRHQREFKNRHHSLFSPFYDKTNYLINRAVDSRTRDVIEQPNKNIKTDREKDIKRMVDLPNKQKVMLRKLFDKNRRGSSEIEQQYLNDYYDGSSKHYLDNSKQSNTHQNYLNRMADVENQRVNERFKEYDTASIGDSDRNFEENKQFSDEVVQPKHKHKNSLIDKEKSNPSENNEAGILLRKISRVEYLVRNDKGVFDLLNKEMPNDIYSLLKNFHVTSIYDSEVKTEMGNMAPKMSSYNDKNDLPKAENSNIPNESEQKAGNENSLNKSEGKSNSEKDSLTDQLKSPFTYNFNTIPNEITNDNANKKSDNSNYEYDEEEDDQNLSQTEKFLGTSSADTKNIQSEHKDLPPNEITNQRTSIQNENDKEESTSVLLDYELGKPTIIPHIIPSLEQSGSGSATTLQTGKQTGYDESTTIEEQTEISTTDARIHLIVNENEPWRNNSVQSDSYTTSTDAYLESKPQTYKSGYDTRHPPVLPQVNEVDKETDPKRIQMHIRPPHRMTAPEIRYKRKLKVSSHQEVAADSPINQEFPSRRKRRQIDVDRRGIIDQQTRNVPADDCCYNGGTCFTSLLTPGVPPSRWCECPPSFEGRYCEEAVNECVIRTPCVKDHELCVNTQGGFNCVCQEDFVRDGDDCIPRVTCEEFPCLNGAECVDVDDGHFECYCPLGYVGRTCDMRVEECEDSFCSKNEICISTETGFKCEKAENVESL